MRDGKISGREHFIIEQAAFEDDETILSQFIVRFYSGTAKVPKNIYVPCIEDLEILEFLSKYKMLKVEDAKLIYKSKR